jgi:glycosyltransferase involved in cell wall biosynthesis
MTEFMILLFWFSVFMIFYAYFGYPLVLIAISLFKKNPPVKKADTFKPLVTHIITAYNEQDRIREKIENALAQDYPEEKMEIIVASDCSNDSTDEIVKSFADKGVRLVRAPERKGKENAQKYAVEAANGEILVFSDVSTYLKADGVSCIVTNFAEPSIGCVSSEDKFIDADGKISGEGAYVRYEMFLRKLECRVNTLVGLSGSFFAARRQVCANWATDLQSDFNTLLNSIKEGKKGILDSESLGYYKNINDESREFNRKVRTVLRGITVLMSNVELLNPLRYGFFSFQLFSHKICRWLVPFFLIIAFIANVISVCDSYLYALLLILQIVFYVAGSIHFFKMSLFKSSNGFSDFILKATRIFYYFAVINASILFAWVKYFKSERAVLWEPSRR